MRFNRDWFSTLLKRLLKSTMDITTRREICMALYREQFSAVSMHNRWRTVYKNHRRKRKTRNIKNKICNTLRRSKEKNEKRLTGHTYTMKQTWKYLAENKDIVILNGDKGNKTVDAFKMNDILKDMCTYKRLNRNPRSTLQNKKNTLVDKLYKLNIIFLTTKNKVTIRIAVAPRIYELSGPSYELSKYLKEFDDGLYT